MALSLIGAVSLDGSGFERGLGRIEAGARRTGDVLKGLAVSAFGVYAIERALSKTEQSAEHLVNTSRQLGISLEALQELGFAARQNGADIEQLTAFIQKLNETRIDPKHFGAFQNFGINPTAGSVEDIVMQLSANIQKRNPQSFAKDLKEIGGKGARDMINMLRDDLENLRAEARRAGIVISTETLVQIKFLHDQFKLLADVVQARLSPALAKLIPRILQAVNLLKSGITLIGGAVSNLSRKNLMSAMNPFSRDSLLDLITEGMSKAAGAAALNLALDNAETDKMLAALVSKQKFSERFGGLDSMPDLDTRGLKGSKPYSDSLLRVGNFLGGSSNPIISIAQAQLAELRLMNRKLDRLTAGSETILPPL